ncbi:MAG: hypothetical protein ACR2KT_16710 [Methylocella sp.]
MTLGVLQPIQDVPHDWNFRMPAITANWTAGSANFETLIEVDVAARHRAFVGHREGRLHRVNFQRRPQKSEIVEFPMIMQHLNSTARIEGSRHGVAVRRKVAVCGEVRIRRPRRADGQGERDLVDVPQLLVVLEEARVFKQERCKAFPRLSDRICMAGGDVEDTPVEIRGKSRPDIPIALELFRKRNRCGFENPGQDMNWWAGPIHYLSSDAVPVRDHERGRDRDVDVQKQQPGRFAQAELIDNGKLLQLVAIFSVQKWLDLSCLAAHSSKWRDGRLRKPVYIVDNYLARGDTRMPIQGPDEKVSFVEMIINVVHNDRHPYVIWWHLPSILEGAVSWEGSKPPTLHIARHAVIGSKRARHRTIVAKP